MKVNCLSVHLRYKFKTCESHILARARRKLCPGFFLLASKQLTRNEAGAIY